APNPQHQTLNDQSLQQFTTIVGRNTHPQGVQLNKAFRVFLIVSTTVVFKGRDTGIEQAVVRLTAHHDHVTFIQLQTYHTVYRRLRLVDHGLQHGPFRAPPVAVVNQAGVAWHQFVFQVRHFTVQGDGFDGTVCFQHDGAARSFVATAGLHAHITVFDDIQTADAVGTTDFVQGFQHCGRAHFDAVDGDNVAALVGQFHIGRNIWRGFRADRPAPHIFFVLGPGVFQHAAFIGNVQQVSVHGVGRFLTGFVEVDRDIALFGIGHQGFTGSQIPFTPRRNHFYTRLQGIGTQLETHLVVTFAGGAVGNSIGTGFVGNFNQALGDQRAGNGGAQQVFAFVNGVGAEHREDEIAYEFFAQVFNVNFFNAHGFGFGAGRLDFFT